MKKPILTIGIPTYNNASALHECLAAITTQFSDKNVFDHVDIFISDNCDGGRAEKIVDEYHSDNGAEDRTREVVEEYQKKFSNICYSQNGKNIGFDRNVDAVLSNAKGEFCWTLSNNDHIEPGSIAYVLSTIQKNGDAAYFCISNKKEDKKNEMRRFNNGSQWLKEMGLFGGQISQCIFNVRYLPRDRAKYYDNAWFHLAVFWEIAAHRPIVLLPCLFKIPEESLYCGWARGGWGFRTYIYLKRIVASLPQYGYADETINDILCGLARNLPRNVASAKVNGLPVSVDQFSLLVKEFYRYPFYLLCSIGIFLTPAFFLKLAKRMK